MKKILTIIFFVSVFFTYPLSVLAQSSSLEDSDLGAGSKNTNVMGHINAIICGLSSEVSPVNIKAGQEVLDPCLSDRMANVQNSFRYMAGFLGTDEGGNVYSPGIIGVQQRVIASLITTPTMPSQREYYADLLDNIGIPTVSETYAQGTGYTALSSFLPFWKVFRNLAYSLYIIMFVVVGIMIMLRTKINSQTIITIQSALPNLLITLLLITFSYAIVGFMIDIMYFLIYFVVYLLNLINIIDTPTQAINRLLNYSAWSVIFEGRNSIISAAALAIGEVISGLGTGLLEVAGTIVSMGTIMYLVVAVAFAISMLKLMVALIKAYVMIIVQTITAPVQILMNAMPGSQAFASWLKTTASYILPFPVAAVMFIFSAVMMGDPTKATILEWAGDANPFGINQSHEFYSTGDQSVWLPPFTLTGNIDFTNDDIRVLLGFFIFLMTPAAVKMAQDWLQVKESPYTAEAFTSASMGVNAGMIVPKWLIHHQQEDMQMKRQAALFNNMKSGQSGNEPKQPGVR